jgi:hypothetical protein
MTTTKRARINMRGKRRDRRRTTTKSTSSYGTEGVRDDVNVT